MPSDDYLREADRVMGICNSCRYCEGFCAVFQAMELRRTFEEQDLTYLANLCHNCRDCYYACQYAPPHEFDMNVPKTLAELRIDTYREFAWPNFLAGLFRQNGLSIFLITLLSIAIVRFTTIPAVGLGFYIALSLLIGLFRFSRKTGANLNDMMDLRAHAQAIRDTVLLKYLDGGGHGCNYPNDRFSMMRRWLHQLVFFGFLLCLASGTIAAIYNHFMDWSAPYPFWSWPAVLGTAGGVGLLIGNGGLLYLKGRMDLAPAAPISFGMDVGFMVLLFLAGLTGLLLLSLRDTTAMGVLFDLHLGIVLSLFLSLPYGKFVHALYRYAALVRHSIEQNKLFDIE